MNVLVPPGLRPGATVAVVSPASAALAERIDGGVRALEAYGYGVRTMPHAYARGPLYYAGTAEQRAQDLHDALCDDSVHAVMATRGGWGSAELLPLLDAMGTAAVLRARPKLFVGYSDHTSLQAWLWNECRMRSVYGPMVAADWYKPDGVHLLSWRACVDAGSAARWRVGAEQGLRVLRAGSGPPVEGRLLGGCLAILAEALGTPYALRIDEKCVLFAEDTGVKPYQWDRLLQHLRWAGMLAHVQAIVLGDMSANVTAEELPLLEAACLHALRDFRGPVLIGLQSGHVDRGNVSVPLGAWVRVAGTDITEMAAEQGADAR